MTSTHLNGTIQMYEIGSLIPSDIWVSILLVGVECDLNLYSANKSSRRMTQSIENVKKNFLKRINIIYICLSM